MNPSAVVSSFFYWTVFIPIVFPLKLLNLSRHPPRWIRYRKVTNLARQSSIRRKSFAQVMRALLRFPILLLYYLLLVVLVGEIIVRLTLPNHAPLLEEMERLRQFHQPYGHFVWRGLGGGPEICVDVQLNALGYHDIDHSFAKPPGTFRILVIGDSMVEGLHIPRDKTFYRILDEDLSHRCPVPVEVIALGWSGFGQVQELQLIEREGLRFNPDLIVLEFVGWNDVRDNNPTLLQKVEESHGEFLRWSSPVLNRTPFRQSRFLRSLAERIDGLYHRWRLSKSRGIDRANPTLHVFLRGWNDPDWEEGWRRTDEAIVRTAILCRERNISLIVALFPCREQISSLVNPGSTEREWTATYPPPPGAVWDTSYPTERIQSICRKRNIPTIDLIGPGADYARRHGVALHFRTDPHLNEPGNRSVAETLSEALRSRVH